MEINTFLKFLAVMILMGMSFLCGRNATTLWGGALVATQLLAV